MVLIDGDDRDVRDHDYGDGDDRDHECDNNDGDGLTVMTMIRLMTMMITRAVHDGDDSGHDAGAGGDDDNGDDSGHDAGAGGGDDDNGDDSDSDGGQEDVQPYLVNTRFRDTISH